MMKFIKSIRFLHTLKYKIFFAFLLPSIALLCTVSVAAYLASAQLLEKRLLQSAGDTITQTANSLQNFINKYDTLTLSFTLSGKTQALLTQNLDGYNINRATNDLQNFESALYTFVPTRLSNSSAECGIRLYFTDNFTYFKNETRYFNYSDVQDEAWFKNVMSGYRKDRSSFYFISPDENLQSTYGKDTFSIARVILDTTYYPNPLAVLIIDIPRSYLDSSIENTNVDNVSNFVSSSNGTLLACSNRSNIDLYNQTNQTIIKNKPLPNTWTKVTIKNTTYLCRDTVIDSYGLTLSTIIPYRNVLADIEQLRNIIILFGILLIGVSFLIANFIANSITKRVLMLNKKMGEAKSGRFNAISMSKSPYEFDEIDELIDAYNYMIEEIVKLIEMRYQNGIAIKSAELRILQAQINPHFLYNTLDLIHWLCDEQKLEEINIAVNALATFYRVSLSMGNEHIRLKDELAQVGAYIKLQNLRFQNSIQYICAIEEQYLNIPMIKMILQPIVENGIQHGIFEKDTGGGKITIHTQQESDTILHLVVTDDGVGMLPECLERLNKNLSISTEGHGYGVQNVNSRLVLNYGADFRLKFESIAGVGTSVYIKIPIILTPDKMFP